MNLNMSALIVSCDDLQLKTKIDKSYSIHMLIIEDQICISVDSQYIQIYKDKKFTLIGRCENTYNNACSLIYELRLLGLI